tara:strand:+ start:1408 stop:1677 length:270 start_codon:yes stop_codon:yes gene_type:complete
MWSVEFLLTKVWVVGFGYLWYALGKSDKKAKEAKDELDAMKAQISRNEINQAVSDEKLDSIILLVNSKIDPISEDVGDIKRFLMNKPHK